ncbi:MAG: hypothetical protein R3E66_15600 [bacterium]
MAARTIKISDDKKRDADIQIEGIKGKARLKWVNARNQPVQSERLIKATEDHTYDALLKKFGDDNKLALALVDADPEIPFDKAGRRVGSSDRVWIRQDGSVLYCARTLLVRTDATGEEIERSDFVDVEATVGDDKILPWTGRMFSRNEIVHKFAVIRKIRLRHINGLTFDFLYEIAKTLQEQDKGRPDARRDRRPTAKNGPRRSFSKPTERHTKDSLRDINRR